MTKVRARGEQARRFILAQVQDHPSDIAKRTAEKFAISRQAANRHLQLLVDEGVLLKTGGTRDTTYRLCPTALLEKVYAVQPGLAEDVVWREDIAPALGHLPGNAMEIWHYGCTEMFNNAIDHANANTIIVRVEKTAVSTRVEIYDNGIGIFRKIQRELRLLDERHAVLELSKGKLTTDPARHSGEGIFFTSRMFDRFFILSGDTSFSHAYGRDEDWILDGVESGDGTGVSMALNNHTSRTLRKVFDQFTDPETFGFTKTVVPVRLAQYGDDQLVSRSQAMRLLDRIDRFQRVIFDFRDVSSIGQAFADEIFRVFASQHPDIELGIVHANDEVQKMVTRATNNLVNGA